MLYCHYSLDDLTWQDCSLEAGSRLGGQEIPILFQYEYMLPLSEYCSTEYYPALDESSTHTYSISSLFLRLILTHSGRGHLNCLNARSRGF